MMIQEPYSHLRYGDASLSHHLTSQIFNCLNEGGLHLSNISEELLVMMTSFYHNCSADLQLQIKRSNKKRNRELTILSMESNQQGFRQRGSELMQWILYLGHPFLPVSGSTGEQTERGLQFILNIPTREYLQQVNHTQKHPPRILLLQQASNDFSQSEFDFK